MSDITVTVYNSDGTVRSVNALGSPVATTSGNDVYLIDASSSATFNGLHKRGAVALDTDGTVHQFISFDDGQPVTATAGAADTMTSTQVGQAGGGSSLESTDGGGSYQTQNNPSGGGVPCFVRGTHLQTSKGLKKVEDLRPTDLLVNHAGDHVAVKLVLSSKISAQRLTVSPNLRPICISAGCLGLGLPSRDLFVSPQHRVLVASPIVQRMFDETQVLVAAKRLTELPGIYQVIDTSEVEYFHIVAEQHEILISEGIPTESFLIGPQASNILIPEQMEEVFALFPNALCPHSAQSPASHIPVGRLQKKLIMRHAKNKRALITSCAA